MKRNRAFLFAMLGLLLGGVGCVAPSKPASKVSIPIETPSVVQSVSPPLDIESSVVLPLDGNVAGYNPWYKRFGEYFQDRFSGYHVGEDAEVRPEDLRPGEVQEVPVRAIADGDVLYVNRVSGYGGVMVIAHDVQGEKVNAIYGHIDRSSTHLKVGDHVGKGQFLAYLGADKSKETDGERQHLHFALYRGDDIRLSGYEKQASAVSRWINPQDFFAEQGISEDLRDSTLPLHYFALTDPQGKKIFKLDFIIPAGWDVEYVPQIQALNLYRVTGSGTARERSQIFIRYFDADQFLTLPTVTIHNTEDRTVGTGNYTARRYDVEKKSGVPDFPHQPAWRNRRHIVTDFRASSGRTRYYVVAANPDLPSIAYEQFLKSVEILNE